MENRLNHDPSNDICPDYAHERHNIIRQALVNSEEFPDVADNDQAITHLRNIWVAENEEHRQRWQQQVEADRQVEEERRQQREETQRLAEEEEKKKRDEKMKEKEKKKEIIHPFELGTPLQRGVTQRIHPYAKEKMNKWEYVPLWYFTTEATNEARKLVQRGMEDDVFGLSRDSEGKLTVSTNPTTKPSPKAKDDDQLTWAEVINAKPRFLKALESSEWPTRTRQMWTAFYVEMEMHHENDGDELSDKLFAEYHARMRLLWFEQNRLGHPFDVSLINDEVLNQARSFVNKADVKAMLSGPEADGHFFLLPYYLLISANVLLSHPNTSLAPNDATAPASLAPALHVELTSRTRHPFAPIASTTRTHNPHPHPNRTQTGKYVTPLLGNPTEGRNGLAECSTPGFFLETSSRRQHVQLELHE
ncbi:hypothetical protein PQX77_014705 [Marasmius sp. AFHP31]|nr:hypothetical protein PQX77_014705 [Marasmius sp. AFHP31]